MAQQFVAYFRVSTEEQGDSGVRPAEGRLFVHQGGGGGDGKCKCGNKFCPATKYPDGQCDVYGDPGYGRRRNMRDNYPSYVKEVNEARKKAGRKELDYANVWPKKEVETPNVGMHSFSAGRAAAIRGS